METEEFNKIKNELVELPEKITQSSKRIVALQRKINAIETKKKLYENECYKNVRLETEDNGKKKFSVEDAKAEVFRRLSVDVEFNVLCNSETETEMDISEEKIEHDRLKMILKVIELTIELYKVR